MNVSERSHGLLSGIAAFLFAALTFTGAYAQESTGTDGAAAKDTQTPTSRESLDVTFLMNEGFLLRAGEKSVVIDAFLERNAYGYGALGADTMSDLLEGRAPFDRVSVVLVSHNHGDHFQLKPATRYLRLRQQAVLLSSSDVIDPLRASDEGRAQYTSRLRTIEPPDSSFETVEHDGIRIDFFRLEHGGRSYDEIRNFGHIIHLGGKKVLHVGDAHAADPRFPKFDLADREIDVAILPFWMFTDRARVEELVKAKHWIAAHLKPGQVATYRQIFDRDFPEVITFSDSMQSRKF